MTKDELEREIADAFPETPPPTRIAGDTEYWEALEAEQSFRGRTWRAITPRDARYYAAHLLGPEGWSYYLPAYLLASFEDFDVLSSTLHDLRVDYDVSLATSDGAMQERLQQFQDARLAALTPMQRRAVHDFLRFLVEDPKMRYELGGEAEQRLAEWERWLASP